MCQYTHYVAVEVRLAARLLFIGAHCDDIELFAGGLLARACNTSRRVGVLVVSDHRGALDETVAARARAESSENLAWLRAECGADIHDHPGHRLPACRGAFQAPRSMLYAAMEALRNEYDMVVSHAPTDTNQD